MLKGISSLISPELLKVLMEMGHGDEIVIADSNFPAASHAVRLIRADGHDIPAMLSAMLALLPLDQYAEFQVALMDRVPGDIVPTPIWQEYRKVLDVADDGEIAIEMLDRFAFYERAKRAYAIVATGERAQYANILLKKGVIKL